MAQKEQSVHIPIFQPAEVFKAGSRVRNVPNRIGILAVSFSPGVEVLTEGVGVFASIDLLEGIELEGEVTNHSEDDGHVDIEVESSRARASLELILGENIKKGGTNVHYNLAVILLGRRSLFNRMAGQLLKPHVDKIAPVFASQYRDNVIKDLASVKRRQSKAA